MILRDVRDLLGGRAGTLIGLLPGDGKDSDKAPDEKFSVHTEERGDREDQGCRLGDVRQGEGRVRDDEDGPGSAPTMRAASSTPPAPMGPRSSCGGAGMNVDHRDGAINSLFLRTDAIQGWGAYLDNYDISKLHSGRVTAVCDT